MYGWLIAAAVCVVLLPSLADSVNTDSSTFLPASAPTQHALAQALAYTSRISTFSGVTPGRSG